VHLVDGRPGAEVDLRGASVEAGDAVGPQPVEQVGVVAVAEERLGVGAHQLGVEVGHDGDLVLASDGREHGPDPGVAERRVQVGGPVLRRRTEAAGRGVLDRHEAGQVLKPPHRLLVHLRRDRRRGERGGQHRHLVPSSGLARTGQRLVHLLSQQ